MRRAMAERPLDRALSDVIRWEIVCTDNNLTSSYSHSIAAGPSSPTRSDDEVRIFYHAPTYADRPRSFQFEWPRFSESFHRDACQMLDAALNKGNKPPIIADKIEVVELEMGKQVSLSPHTSCLFSSSTSY
jgi:hypothetical protein